MEGDEDEEDVDDIEHEFNIDNNEQNNNKNIAEAMLFGKMSYGRGPEDNDDNINAQYPPVIAGQSHPVRENYSYTVVYDKLNSRH